MTATSMGRGVSVYEMLRYVGRAGVATRSGTAEELTEYLKTLQPEELVEEFHRAVVVLSERGLLSASESAAMAEYACDWVHCQPLPAERM